MPSAASDLIAHPLTAVRLQQGWTLADVATIVQRRSNLNMAVRREKVWRWEHGRAVPELPAQDALANELGVDPALVRAHGWPGWLLLAGAIEPTGGSWTPRSATDVLDRVVSSAIVDRLGFLILSGTSVTGLALTWSTAEPARLANLDGGRVIGEAVDHLEARLVQLWRLDDVLGGGSCLVAGVADLRLVQRLIRDGRYPADVSVRLWSLAAALGRFCGWAAFDAGREAAAQRFWHAGLRAAAAAGDVDQGVYVLSNLALQAAYAGDGATTVGLLDVARHRVDPAARTVLAMLDCWAVRGHALSGNAKTAAGLLNQADDLWERRREADDPSWVYWMPQPSLTAEAGTALLDIDDLPAAERCLSAGLAALDSDSARDRNLYLVRLAETRLRAGRLDEAAATTRDAIDAAAGIDSARVATTYEWVLEHEKLLDQPLKWREWYGDTPSWVFTHRDLPAVPTANITFVSGDVRPVHEAMVSAAQGKNVWLAGGGELVGAFADHGLLDEIILGVAPVTLGAGAPLLPRRLPSSQLALSTVERVDPFVYLTYVVRYPPAGVPR